MTEVNAMVVFYSRYGETERLALAAGVGVVQARANLRLRRLKDLADAETIARDPRWAGNLQRMTPEYIAPREIDAQWADVILLASSPDSPAEMEQYLALLPHISNKKPGLLIVPLVDAADAADRLAAARAQARQAAEQARERKS
jgi:hypothetical protein